MPSNFLTPFVELDDELCKNFHRLDVTGGSVSTMQKQRTVGLQRSHSVCPGMVVNSSSIEALNKSTCFVSENWNKDQQQLPRSSISQIPFRVDRSVSMIESGHVRSSNISEQVHSTLPGLPLSDFSTSTSSLASTKCQLSTTPMSTRYKTELCRTYEESGTCKYEAKCQFAHGIEELRGLSRHPKYKTEPCRTFHTIGFCPYGARCHFIHNADEQLQQLRERPLLLHQSVSFSGFPCQASAALQTMQKPITLSTVSTVSPLPSSGSPDALSPMFSDFWELGALKQGSLPSSDLHSSHIGFTTKNQSKSYLSYVWKTSVQNYGVGSFTVTDLSAHQRSMSVDSLSDQDGYTSSSSLSGSESPGIEGKRLPIFSRLSVLDD